MDLIDSIRGTRQALSLANRAGRCIGFVPTMGALHEGHWSLVRAARARCDVVVVSIFVNPIQFGPSEDLDAYPRTMDKDLAGCERLGCDVVFAPSPREMYPNHTLTRVVVRHLGEPLCGRTRPGHFEGVATVVCKLLNIVGPDVAYFGEKDYQQLAVIRRMVLDLNIPVEIVGCPTVREADGLAMSSRNAYLTPDERTRAACLYAALTAAGELVRQGERDAERLIAAARQRIEAGRPESIEYIEVMEADTLRPVKVLTGPERLCVAARFGSARLIDNVALDARATAV